MKAMILAAGLGTRLKPFTEKHPKALVPIHSIPVLQRNINYLRLHGVKEIVVNVHHFATQIIDFIQENNIADVIISDETNEVLETGGGLKKAQPFLQDSETFVLMNVDILTDLNLTQMIQFHEQQNALATLAISERTSSRYFLFNNSQQLCGWKNIKTNEEKISRNEQELKPFAFSGLHIISSSIFKHITQQGKFSMVDVYLALAKQHTIIGYNHTGSRFIDVGKPESIVEAEKLFV